MFELYERSVAKLELNQVLSQLADCAGSELGKKAIPLHSISPFIAGQFNVNI